MRLLGKRILVAPIPPPASSGGILLPETVRDDINTGGPKLFRVVQVSKNVTEVEAGDRVLCHSYTSGATPLEDGTRIMPMECVIMALPKSVTVTDMNVANEPLTS